MEGLNAALVQFNAFSNKTYTVQSSTNPIAATAWSKVADLVALPTNHLVAITNGIETNQLRYYRLITPRIP